MNEALATKMVMLSALDEWSTLDELSDLARRVLPPEEVETVSGPLRKTAVECLEILSMPPTSPWKSADTVELPEVAILQSKLRQMSSKIP